MLRLFAMPNSEQTQLRARPSFSLPFLPGKSGIVCRRQVGSYLHRRGGEKAARSWKIWWRTGMALKQSSTCFRFELVRCKPLETRLIIWKKKRFDYTQYGCFLWSITIIKLLNSIKRLTHVRKKSFRV